MRTFFSPNLNQKDSNWCWAECANIWMKIRPTVSEPSLRRAQAVIVIKAHPKDDVIHNKWKLCCGTEFIHQLKICSDITKYHLYAFISLIQHSYCFSCLGNAIMLKQIRTNTNKLQQRQIQLLWTPGHREKHTHTHAQTLTRTHSKCTCLTKTHTSRRRD